MSTKKTSSKKSTKSTKSTKTAPKKTHLTMAEQADAFAKKMDSDEAQMEALRSGKPGIATAAPEFVGKTRAFAGAALPTKAKRAAAPKAEKTPRVTVTSVAEDLIKAERTDEEVLEALTKQFPDFDAAKKRHYPVWYRARLVRSGEITKAFADQHRHATKKE